MTDNDTGYAPQVWEFDPEVTRVFDSMLARSIPQYDVMRRAVIDITSTFVVPGTHIVDLGCSRGTGLATFIERYGAANKYVGCDVSEPMLQAAKTHLSGPIADGYAQIYRCDLRDSYPDVSASVTLSVLTLQFTPLELRQSILKRMYEHTRPGGVVVLVEKLIGSTAEIDRELVRVYYDMKRHNGYSDDDIERKRLALQGVLVPLKAEWNEQALKSAGFTQVECFWRWMNFAGWIAVRDGGN